jgi:hypothetical protein
MKIKIIAAVVDTRQLTLYKENGEAVVIPQGDPRLARIVAEATPFLARNEPVEVDLTTKTVNHYKDFEESSGGLVKFFRVAKNKLKSLFAVSAEAEPKTIQPMTLGTVPGNKEEKITAAVAEIMQHAVSVSAPEFDDQEIGENADNTVIAVMKQVNAAPAVVTNIESIEPQLAHANANGSTIGVQRFMERMAAVVNKRRHSVEDLMKFLQKGDLPIAHDGSIIIYKVLNKVDDHYVDCHTWNVPQKVGSYVCMDESLVDPDRRNDCSNGLHVARRGYISGFSGDVCVLAKVKPEDVIAVPQYDANKMRVCGYHILFELSQEDHTKLRNNKPITDTVEGQKLLGKAIAGDHAGILEEVRIGGHKGTNIKVTPVKTAKAKPVKQKPTPLVAAIEESSAVPQAPALDPKAVATAVVVAKQGNARQQKAKALWETTCFPATELERTQAAQALLDFKKAAKVSWATLGLPDATGADLTKLLS